MDIICCPVRLYRSTQVALELYAPEARIKYIEAGNIEEPWTTYSQYWRKASDDLLIIEQDIVIHGQVIPQFESCPEPWCLFPFPHYSRDGELMDSGIGCNRFRKEFMREVTVEDVESQYASCNRCDAQNPKCWAHLDGRTREAGEARGFRIHVHYPPVGHRD